LGLASLVIRTGLQIFFLTLPPSAAAVARVVPLDFDYRVFAFTLVTSGLTTIMFALVPALQATRGTLTCPGHRPRYRSPGRPCELVATYSISIQRDAEPDASARRGGKL